MSARLEYVGLVVAGVVVAHLALFLTWAAFPYAPAISILILFVGVGLAAFILFVPERR